MKKSSAFSVFASKGNHDRKGKKMATPTGPQDTQVNLKRAGSTPTMGKGKKILNSIRASVRGSGGKSRPPANLKNREDSPHVAGDSGRQVSLTSLKAVKTEDTDKGSCQQSTKPAVDRASKPLSQSNLKSSLPVSQSNLKSSLPVSQSNLKSSLPVSLSKSLLPASQTSARSLIPAPGKPPTLGVSGVENKAADNGGKAATKRPSMKDESGPSKAKKKRKGSDSSSVTEEKTGGATVSGKVSRKVPYMFDSTVEASRMFDILIHPVTADKFFRELWEQKPLLVRRHTPDYNSGWFSTAEFDRILRQENIQFGVNLDITSYVDDKRETHNPAGRAYGPVVWDFYQKGCSVRFLNPHTYSRNMWKILSVLQEFFNCSVGANVYLTPPGTQGFAPHYDDIEAFVIQLEGQKHWKLYNPRSDEETLPRFSSDNFSQSDLGKPILDVVLKAGDLLYFPRGTIHQALADEKEHSLHVTFSCYQRNTWADLLEKLIPQALATAIEENVEFRRGLPCDYLNYMGIVHQDRESSERDHFQSKVAGLVRSLVDYLPLDAACDQMGKQAIHDALPPVLTKEEKACSIHGTGEHWNAKEQQVRGVVELEPDSRVRIIRHGVLRMLTEEDSVRIYHSLENARVYHANTPQYIEIESELAPAVEYLIDVYPEYVPIDGLPLDSLDEKLGVASTLYDKGLLMTEDSLQTMYDEGSGSEEDDTKPS